MEDEEREKERETHLAFMREALAMASLALPSSETPVGCVLVHNNTIIGRGMNATNRTYNGTRHAEFVAINEVLTSSSPTAPTITTDQVITPNRPYDASILRSCTLYVTVEPCIMCASLLRQFGIRRVFFGASNEKFGGTGGVLSVHRGNGRFVFDDDDDDQMGGGKGGEEKRGKEKGEEEAKRGEADYEVSGGWLREEAILLLRRFYVQENERAPEPRGKDGRSLNLVVEPLGPGGSGNGSAEGG